MSFGELLQRNKQIWGRWASFLSPDGGCCGSDASTEPTSEQRWRHSPCQRDFIPLQVIWLEEGLQGLQSHGDGGVTSAPCPLGAGWGPAAAQAPAAAAWDGRSCSSIPAAPPCHGSY